MIRKSLNTPLNPLSPARAPYTQRGLPNAAPTELEPEWRVPAKNMASLRDYWTEHTETNNTEIRSSDRSDMFIEQFAPTPFQAPEGRHVYYVVVFSRSYITSIVRDDIHNGLQTHP